MCDSTLAIYCFIDDFLKASGHREDIRTEVTDAEIITIALTAMLHFGGNAREKSAGSARTRLDAPASESFALFAADEPSGGFDLPPFSSTRRSFEANSLGIALFA